MSTFPFTVTEHVIDAQYIREYPRATATQEAPLKLCVKKYTPIDNPNPQPGDVTLIGAHGTGFSKELYEPLWEELLARSKQDGYRIRAIWIADAVNQNASGILNEQHLGNDPSWQDHSRDILHMINHFRAEMPRPLMGIGHSVGGVQLVFLSMMHPRLFTTLALIEPYTHNKTDGSGADIVYMTTAKKDLWPSHAAAASQARKIFRFWDPRVLDRWVKYGYRALPTATHTADQDINKDDPPVTLTTTKHQESFMYARKNTNRHKQLGLPDELDNNGDNGPSPPHDPLFYPDMIGPLFSWQKFYRPETLLSWALLPHLRSSALFLSGTKSFLSLAGWQSGAAERTGTAFGGSGGMKMDRVRHVSLKAGHTVPLEKVAETAGVVGPWLGEELARWKEDEKRVAEGWEDLSLREKGRISREWQAAMDSTALNAGYQKKRASKM